MACNDGRIGLIDYGNAPELTIKQRVDISKFILALEKDDMDEIVACYIKCGAESKKMNKKFLYFSAKCDFD